MCHLLEASVRNGVGAVSIDGDRASPRQPQRAWMAANSPLHAHGSNTCNLASDPFDEDMSKFSPNLPSDLQPVTNGTTNGTNSGLISSAKTDEEDDSRSLGGASSAGISCGPSTIAPPKRRVRRGAVSGEVYTEEDAASYVKK
ncbi:unnamed protein product [Protopolystoma xenopodis]|uniref:Uncharacterized protein n=1 Tax=Protopolystoma xenopodis TaxID=117903 RepID=A0A3S5CUT1_9PLAT|nr:unnamed protein product [Protopolystoma xenopodis]